MTATRMGGRHQWGLGIVGRPVIAFVVAGALTVGSADTVGADGRIGAGRGSVVVVITGTARASGSACVVLRDLTENMVVGSYCDGDATDQAPKTGQILLDLPRRSFAIDARAPGATVTSVSPRRFTLGARQTVLVRLG